MGHGQESITLIAYDAEGMSQAVGSMYEAMAGIEPLTPLVGPKANQITAATRTDVPPEPQVVWQACLPDRAAAMKADGDVLTVLTWDQSSSQVDRDGHAAAPKPLAPDAYAAAVERMKTPADPAAWKLAKDHPVPGRIPKFAASLGKLAAIGYWGGLVTIVDADGKVKTAHQFQDGLAGLVPFGEVLVVGLSDGRLVGLKVR